LNLRLFDSIDVKQYQINVLLLGTIVFIRLQAAVELAIQSLQSCHIVTLTMMIRGVISTKNQKIQSITPLLQISSCKPNEHPAALAAASV